MAGQAGTAAKTDRPGLLIALVSRDVIVLAKLVRTLCPRQVLLFWTAGARDGGWTEGATELLKGLQEHRPEVLQGFRVIDLRSVDCPSKLDWFRRTIDDGVNRIQEDVEAVVFDCRTGQSIFHVLGFDAIRPIGLERGVELSAVYIDADTRSIVRSTARGGGIEYHQQHTAFRYESGKELVERFGIYGFVPRGALRLCPNPPDPVGYDGLCELYDALCRDKGLRALFHSYWLKLYRWKQRKIAAGADCAVDIPALMRGALVRIAAWVSRQTNQAGQQVPARYALAQALDDLVPAGSAVAWLDHYLSDRKLSALKRKLHQYAESLGQQLLTGRAFGQRLSDFAQGLPREFKTLVGEIRGGFERLARSAGHDPSLFRAAEHRELEAMRLSPVVGSLVVHAPKLADLFEACLGAAVTRAAERRFGDRISAVVQNVEFFKDERPVAELDTVILFKDGDVSGS